MERLQMLSQQIRKYLLLFLLTASGVICQDWIRPSDQRTSVSSTEGDPVTLVCSYDTSSSYVLLYWYRQFSNTQPENILLKGGRSQTYENIPDPDRFGSTTSQKSTSLTIKSVTLSDSALYYCALRVTAFGPTGVLGYADPLTFGNPIRLTVKPKNQLATPPLLSILSPLGGNGPDICLAAGFFPADKTMILTVEGKSPVKLNTSEAPLFHSTYYYAGFSKDDESMKYDEVQKCEMDGRTVDKSVDVPETTEIPPIPTQFCPTSLGASEFIDTGVPKMNSMNLLVSGLRILLAKCVAVNALMTVKAFIF